MWNPFHAAVAVPTTIAGSLALSLSALPAAAAVPEHAAAPELGALARTAPSSAFTSTARAAAVPTTAVRTAVTAPATYTVRKGDTVSAIARRYGLSTNDVLARNGLTVRSVIYPGQVLRLTGGTPAASGPAPASAPASSAPPSSGSVYVIVRGDTITRIARAHGVSTTALLQANRLAVSSIIYPGQKLTIPGAMVPASAQTPVAPAPAPAPSASTYTVRAGDTITAIGARFGVTVDAVLHANGLSRSSIIYPGQRIAIPSPTGLTAEQTANAQLIIRVGRQLGVPDRGIAIALGTAMQESGLRNLSYGDRDSIGLFQQRPSYGWGTRAQIADAERSTRVFYGGPHDPNGIVTRGLLDIPGWQSMTFAQAAQAVQNSAFPNAYAQWEAPAARWLAALG